MAPRYPKRLIEVDLPIKRISEHARRERRTGHISSLHIWWARRPLAACRAVICAALWPDPADPLCPDDFREKASRQINAFARKAAMDKGLATHCSHENWEKWRKLSNSSGLDPRKEAHWNVLRFALLDFIADFSNWDNSAVAEYLETSRALTQAAHEALGGAPGTRPLVVDPFAGGGSIPLEALRVGADAFASDLNPIPVLLNKVVLEYIPKYGQRLTNEVRKWGEWIRREAGKELAEFYPEDSDGATPIAYLWARTIRCEGPACGAEIPLMNQRLISKRRRVGVEFVPKKKDIDIRIRCDLPASAFGTGTVTNGKVTCPKCGFTMSADHYRERAKKGELRQRHYCTVLALADGSRKYRRPTREEGTALLRANKRLSEISKKGSRDLELDAIPNEALSSTEPRRLNVLHYGFERWGDLFTLRQQLCWTVFSRLLHRAFKELAAVKHDRGIAEATSTLLGLILSNMLQYNCSMSTWLSDGMISVFIQSSSIPMRADYAEANPMMERLVGGLSYQLTRTDEVLTGLAGVIHNQGTAACSSATEQLLPDDAVAALITDPPYYFAIPYAELSDFFYVWIKRFLQPVHPDLLRFTTTPKKDEAIQNLPHTQAIGQKNRQHFEDKIFESLSVARCEVGPAGIAVIVFAHASTEGWESLLNALLRAGWIITGSWPIDTEREGRMLASRQRALASSVHLVCRPRESVEGSLGAGDVGDWRDVLRELPCRIHEWMPRLAADGVVGADAIFACLGPALEVFSRYDRVEKANGEQVQLKEYLEYVWAAVSKEALNMIFAGADATGFEEDARLTAMWLWTLSTGSNGNGVASDGPEDTEEHGEDSGKKAKLTGFVLEYDAARKIAQGLGAHLEQLPSLVDISGDKARLLPVSERARHLFGKDEGAAPTKRRGKPKQLSLLDVLEDADDSEGGWGGKNSSGLGNTVLDRIHQSMILFAAGRGEALKRFLVSEGAGQDQRFWRLAQALSALYPKGTDERRWVEGVLARKKGLGF
jgi:putative DNA methylase